MRIGFKIELNFHDLHKKSSVYRQMFVNEIRKAK